MTTSAKVLVLGPPDGPQGSFVAAVSEVKVRSSARTPTGSGEGYVPMDFGRVRIAGDLDLQLFGFERDQVATVAEAVSPGIVGAVLLVDRQDELDPHYASRALEELGSRTIPTVVAVSNGGDPSALIQALGGPALPHVTLAGVDREAVKATLIAALEAALAAEESAA